MENSWPLPWLLGDFTQVAYDSSLLKNQNEEAFVKAAVIFCDLDQQSSLEAKLKKPCFVQQFPLRDAQKNTLAYFDIALFKEDFGKEVPLFVPSSGSPRFRNEVNA